MGNQSVFKKISVCAISALLSFSAITPVFAVDDDLDATYTYSSADGNDTFEKISHPDSSVQTADGLVDYVGNDVLSANDNGQGDRGQSYSWAAQGYVDANGEEWVYIGTCYSALMQTLQLMKSALGDRYDAETMTAALNAMYRGSFFVSEEDGGNPGGVLVKMNARTGELSLLMSKALTGSNVLFRNAISYNGKLYFCGSVGGIPSIYEIDPENNDKITCVHEGMIMQDYIASFSQRICSGIRGMEEYEGKSAAVKIVQNSISHIRFSTKSCSLYLIMSSNLK